MDVEIVFDKSAFKHGIKEQDIRSAFSHSLVDYPKSNNENENLLIGFDTNANLLEVAYNVIDEYKIKIFHAMKCRKNWYSLITQ